MKNKNAILLELSTHVVGSLFLKFFYKENRHDEFDKNNIPAIIESECERQAQLCFSDPKDNVTDRDMFLMKMHAVNFYDKYFSKILLDKIEEDGRKTGA